MIITYNGVELEVAKVIQWSDRNVYSEDNTERLYRHVTFGVQFVINPQATTIPGIDLLSADQIVTELKRRLLQQRRTLVVTSGETAVIQTPPVRTKDGEPAAFDKNVHLHYVDARGGPNPLHCDIISIAGTKTFVGFFALETWLVNNDGLPMRESALISNRWEMTNEVDEQYFSTRTISGRAIFRADFMYERTDKGDYRQVQRKASDYLSYLGHPVPDGYKREHVSSRLSSDGLTLNYTLVDVEQQTILSGGKFIAKVEGVWQAGIGSPNLINGALGLVPNYCSVVVRAWGKRGRFERSTTRQALLDACTSVIASFGINDALQGGWFYDADATVDLTKKFAQVRAQYRVGAGTVEGMLSWLTRDARLTLGGAKDFPEDFGDLLIASQSRQGQRPYEGVYGGGQQRLASQSLRDGNDAPSPTPTTVRQVEPLQALVNFVVGATPTDAETASAARNETERRG